MCKNGKAYNIDGELFSGTVEHVSVSGNRLATTYKDGIIAQREFKPIEGNIELITKKYVKISFSRDLENENLRKINIENIEK